MNAASIEALDAAIAALHLEAARVSIQRNSLVSFNKLPDELVTKILLEAILSDERPSLRWLSTTAVACKRFRSLLVSQAVLYARINLDQCSLPALEEQLRRARRTLLSIYNSHPSGGNLSTVVVEAISAVWHRVQELSVTGMDRFDAHSFIKVIPAHTSYVMQRLQVLIQPDNHQNADRLPPPLPGTRSAILMLPDYLLTSVTDLDLAHVHINPRALNALTHLSLVSVYLRGPFEDIFDLIERSSQLTKLRLHIVNGLRSNVQKRSVNLPRLTMLDLHLPTQTLNDLLLQLHLPTILELKLAPTDLAYTDDPEYNPFLATLQQLTHIQGFNDLSSLVVQLEHDRRLRTTGSAESGHVLELIIPAPTHPRSFGIGLNVLLAAYDLRHVLRCCASSAVSRSTRNDDFWNDFFLLGFTGQAIVTQLSICLLDKGCEGILRTLTQFSRQSEETPEQTDIFKGLMSNGLLCRKPAKPIDANSSWVIRDQLRSEAQEALAAMFTLSTRVLDVCGYPLHITFEQASWTLTAEQVNSVDAHPAIAATMTETFVFQLRYAQLI